MDSTSAPDGRFTRRQAGRLAGAALGTQLFAMPASDICFLSAVEMAALVRRKKLSARELVTAHLEQIERVNPKVNAVVTLVAEQEIVQVILNNVCIAGCLCGGRQRSRRSGSTLGKAEAWVAEAT